MYSEISKKHETDKNGIFTPGLLRKLAMTRSAKVNSYDK